MQCAASLLPTSTASAKMHVVTAPDKPPFTTCEIQRCLYLLTWPDKLHGRGEWLGTQSARQAKQALFSV
eukprot:12042764-Prorocentrum_lima.AAC.1